MESPLAGASLFRGGAVERLIFGEATAEEIAASVDRFCTLHLGAGVAEHLFSAASVGVVVGVRLADGSRVVVKAHQPREPRRFLEAVHRVQADLYEEGFPCPQPLAGPEPLGSGFALVEELVDEGSFENAHRPEMRRAMAETLAWQVELGRDARDVRALAERWQLFTERTLWPREAHSPIFDFEATSPGAEWIDAIAARAKGLTLQAGGSPVAGHADWSAKHFRFVDGVVRVVYDWDSLTHAFEERIVGIAAATFTFTWELDVPLAPTPDESRAFVDEYSAARPTPLSRRQRETIAAVAAFVLAYTARCEHALGIRPPGGATDLLASFGDRYLAA